MTMIRAMKKLLGLVFVVFVVAALVLMIWLSSGRPFGITSDHPLGQLKPTERKLIALGLVKDESLFNTLRKTMFDSQLLTYTDPKQQGDEKRSTITVVADASGTIVSFKAAAAKGGLTDPDKVRVFTRLYWQSVVGALRLDEQDGVKSAEVRSGRAIASWRQTADGVTVTIDRP